MKTPNKNNPHDPIAKFTVRDLPTLKNQKNPVTEEDKALMKNIWASSIERCQRLGLPMDADWLGETIDEGLGNFTAHYAPQRRALRKMYKFSDGQRGSSLEQLRWLNTQNDLAGFYAANLSYTLPINTINPETNLFDLEVAKDEKVEIRDFLGKGNLKAVKGERGVSLTYQFWEKKKVKLVIPTIHNIPSDLAIFISELTGRRTSLTGLIAEGGGSPYHGIKWLRKNKEASLEEAILKSIEMISKEMKKLKDMDFEKIIKQLTKSFSKIPESTIRAIVVNKWTKEGKDMSLEAIKTNLRKKSSHVKSCVVWDERGRKTPFASTDLAAEALGYTVRTVQTYISRGTKTANNYWITRGKEPKDKDLKNIIGWNSFMDVNAKMMHIFLHSRVSPLEEQVYLARLKEPDLAVIAKNLNLKKTKVNHILDKVMDIINTEFSYINKSDTRTKLPVETISANPDTHPEIFRKRSGVGEGDTEFIPYPDQGIPELTFNTSGASNVNRAGKKKGEKVNK